MTERRSGSGPREAITLIPCAACGGEFRRVVESATGYKTEFCKFCTDGHMSDKQLADWRTHRSRRGR